MMPKIKTPTPIRFMGDVVELQVETTCDIPPERILRKAIEEDLEMVVIIGRKKDAENYFSISTADKGYNLLMVERFKKALMSDED